MKTPVTLALVVVLAASVAACSSLPALQGSACQGYTDPVTKLCTPDVLPNSYQNGN